jgi:hypothetical protein
MLKSKLLRITIITVLVMTILVPIAQARLVVGSPENVISSSTLILTGEVISSSEAVEQRTFTVSVDRVLKGEYFDPEIVFTGKKNPVYGWMGSVHTLPKTNTELLLFLRNDDNDNPYFTFDLNCIAVVEGERVTSLLDGSNIGSNDERWEIEDYIETYNELLNTADLISIQTEKTIDGENQTNEDVSFRSMAVTTSVFWPGIIAFLTLLGLSLVGLLYYARSKQNRSSLFWVASILVCIVVSYIIATLAITPLLLR